MTGPGSRDVKIRQNMTKTVQKVQPEYDRTRNSILLSSISFCFVNSILFTCVWIENKNILYRNLFAAILKFWLNVSIKQ